MRIKGLFAPGFSMLLAACGGGSSSSGATPVPVSSTAPAPTPTPAPAPSPHGTATSTYLVSWNAEQDPHVAGYKVFYSTSPLDSGGLVSSVDVGNATTYTFVPALSGINSGSTVYVAVAAYDATGLESPLSSPDIVVVQ